MPTMEQIRKLYGDEMADRMVKSGWLDGITVKILPDGSHDIPCEDILRAWAAARGRDPGDNWD